MYILNMATTRTNIHMLINTQQRKANSADPHSQVRGSGAGRFGRTADLKNRSALLAYRLQALGSPRSGRCHLAHGEPAVGNSGMAKGFEPRQGRCPIGFLTSATPISDANTQTSPLTGLTKFRYGHFPTAGSPWAKGPRRCRGFEKGRGAQVSAYGATPWAHDTTKIHQANRRNDRTREGAST